MSRRRKLFFAAVTVISVLAVLEGAARLVEVVAPPRPVDDGLGFDASSRVFVPSEADPGMLVTNPAKGATFPAQSFPLRKPAGTFRLAIVGGSTVNFLAPELGLMQERLRQALAPRYRDVTIINAGGLSYGSDRLARVASELLTYDLDLLILYSAHNEFEEVEQLQLASLDQAGLRRTASHLALMRLGTGWATDWKVERLREEHNRRILQSAPAPARAWRYPFTAEDVTQRMRAFKDNSALVIRESRKRNVAVIIGTVPSNLVRPYLPRPSWERYREVWALLQAGNFAAAHSLGRTILREAVGRHQSSDLENDIIRALARDLGVPLADVEGAIMAAEPHGIPGETLFIDHCHLTSAGNRIVRETFEKVVLDVAGRPAVPQ